MHVGGLGQPVLCSKGHLNIYIQLSGWILLGGNHGGSLGSWAAGLLQPGSEVQHVIPDRKGGFVVL